MTPIYPNLIQRMSALGIAVRDLATTLCVSEQMVWLKICGEEEFTLTEAILIGNTLNTVKISEIFSSINNNKPQ